MDGHVEQWKPPASAGSGPGNDFEPLGFDVVNRSMNDFFECSPLSCNAGARTFKANAHCLFETLDDAVVAAGTFSKGGWEPGPYYVAQVLRRSARPSPWRCALSRRSVQRRLHPHRHQCEHPRGPSCGLAVAEGRKPYRFERAARADLRQGVFWYEKEREGLGARFATEVQRAIDLILLAPPPMASPSGHTSICAPTLPLHDCVPLRRRPGRDPGRCTSPPRAGLLGRAIGTAALVCRQVSGATAPLLGPVA